MAGVEVLKRPALAAMENRGKGGGEKPNKSVFLDVGGEMMIPNVESMGKLAEMLGSCRYELDLSGAELRMSDNVKKQLFDTGLLGYSEFDALKSHILLRCLASKAPPGPGEPGKFLRKGSRDAHFSVVRAMAMQRRADLETSAKPKMPPPLRKTRSKGLDRGKSNEESAMPGTVGRHDAIAVLVKDGEEGTPTNARHSKENLAPQKYDELCTFRSATTASELGTARPKDDFGRSDEA